MNPNNERDLDRFRRVVRGCYDDLRKARQTRKQQLQNLVGTHYSEYGAPRAMPINLLELFITIMIRLLVSSNPRTLVTTPYRHIKPQAKNLELALNRIITEINLASSLEVMVMDSLFSMGIAKVGMESRPVETELGTLRDEGQPFADPVLFDNWVHDTDAQRYEEAAFAGDMYALPYDFVVANKDFSAKARNKVQRQWADATGLDYGKKHSAHDIGKGRRITDEKYEDMVWMWDYWLPRENLIVTLAEDDTVPPLAVRDFSGPEQGPYRLLTYTQIPGNILPMAPILSLADMNEMINDVWRKLADQAERQKTILAVHGSATEDGNRIINCNDGDAITTENPDGAREFRLGGIDQPSMGFAVAIKDLFVYLAGNLDALGGLAAMSGTVGQDRMLTQNASSRVEFMQEKVVNFTRDILSDIGLHLWNDPEIQVPLVKRIEGTDLELDVVWDESQREGDFVQYDISIEPYSLRSTSPGEKLSTLNQIVMNMLIPGQEMLQANGQVFDIAEYLKIVSKYANLPELRDMVTSLDREPDEEQPSSSSGPKKPPQTIRQYQRHSSSGNGQGGLQQAMDLMKGGAA